MYRRKFFCFFQFCSVPFLKFFAKMFASFCSLPIFCSITILDVHFSGSWFLPNFLMFSQTSLKFCQLLNLLDRQISKQNIKVQSILVFLLKWRTATKTVFFFIFQSQLHATFSIRLRYAAISQNIYWQFSIIISINFNWIPNLQVICLQLRVLCWNCL